MRKFFKFLFVAAGICLIGFSAFLFFRQGPSAAKTARASGGLQELSAGDRVIVRGELTWESRPEDDLFLFSADSPALVRSVEMVQWYRNVNDEVYLTLYAEKLPDFEFDGKSYVNPDLPASMPAKVFSGGVRVDGIPLSDEAVSQLTGGDRMILSSALRKADITDLPLETGEKFGLAKYDGFYATPGEEWTVGDISVSFYYVSPFFYDQVTVVGTVSEDGKLSLGEDGRMWDKLATDEEIDALLRVSNGKEILLCAGGGLLLLFSAFLFFRKRDH